jgi:hypothetical protein
LQEALDLLGEPVSIRQELYRGGGVEEFRQGRWQLPVERRQSTAVRERHRDEMEIGKLAVAREWSLPDPIEVNDLDVVVPKLVTGKSDQAGE